MALIASLNWAICVLIMSSTHYWIVVEVVETLPRAQALSIERQYTSASWKHQDAPWSQRTCP